MPPLTLLIKPASGACNMRCGYCFYADVTSRREAASRGMMSLRTLETLVRRAFSYGEGSINFAFQGGEPTIAGAEFYRALIDFQKKYNSRGVRVQNSIQTNGLELTEEMLAVLSENNFLVGVSLDGSRKTHDQTRLDARGLGTYERVNQNIARLAERGVEYNILCVVTGPVALAADEVWSALSGRDYLQFIPCLDDFDCERREWSLSSGDYLNFLKITFDKYYRAFISGRPVSVRNFDNYINILSGIEPESCAMRGRCGIYYLIEADGCVYPCDFYVLDEWLMGNINETNFLRLEKSPVGARFRETSIKIEDKCRECRWLGLCRGGCRRDREPGLGLNRFCGAYAGFFEYAYPRMLEIAKSLARK